MDKDDFLIKMESTLRVYPTLNSAGVAPVEGVAGHCPDDVREAPRKFNVRRVYVAYLYFSKMTAVHIPNGAHDEFPLALHASAIRNRIQHIANHEDSLFRLGLGGFTIGEVALAALINTSRLAYPNADSSFPVCIPFIYAKPKRPYMILPDTLWADVDSDDVLTGRTSLWERDNEVMATDIPRTEDEFVELAQVKVGEFKPIKCGDEWYHFGLEVPEWLRQN
jgi:hypothetical protein